MEYIKGCRLIDANSWNWAGVNFTWWRKIDIQKENHGLCSVINRVEWMLVRQKINTHHTRENEQGLFKEIMHSNEWNFISIIILKSYFFFSKYDFYLIGLEIKVTDLTHKKQTNNTIEKSHTLLYNSSSKACSWQADYSLHIFYFLSNIKFKLSSQPPQYMSLVLFWSTKKITHEGNVKENLNVLLSMIRSCAQTCPTLSTTSAWLITTWLGVEKWGKILNRNISL